MDRRREARIFCAADPKKNLYHVEQYKCYSVAFVTRVINHAVLNSYSVLVPSGDSMKYKGLVTEESLPPRDFNPVSGRDVEVRGRICDARLLSPLPCLCPPPGDDRGRERNAIL